MLTNTDSTSSEVSSDLSSSFLALANLPDKTEQIHFRTVAGYGRGIKKPIKSGAFILGATEEEQEYLQQQIQDKAEKKGYNKCRPIAKVSSPDKKGIPKSAYTPNGSKLSRKCKQANLLIFEEADSPIKSILKGQLITSVKNTTKLAAPNTNIKSIKTVLTAKSLAEVKSQAEANIKQYGKRRRINQNQVMNNMSARDIVTSLGFDDKRAEGWEWLHLIAHCFAGDAAQIPENLVVGTRACNTQMMIIENMISSLVENGHEVEITSTAELVKIVSEEKVTHLAKKIHLTVEVPKEEFSQTYSFKPCKQLPPEERDGLYLEVAVNYEFEQCKKRTTAKSLITEFARVATEANKENETKAANVTGEIKFSNSSEDGTPSIIDKEGSRLVADIEDQIEISDRLAPIDESASKDVSNHFSSSMPLLADFFTPLGSSEIESGGIGESIAHVEGSKKQETRSPIHASFFQEAGTTDAGIKSNDILATLDSFEYF